MALLSEADIEEPILVIIGPRGTVANPVESGLRLWEQIAFRLMGSFQSRTVHQRVGSGWTQEAGAAISLRRPVAGRRFGPR